MESISVTTYRGFSTVNGETTLAQDMADIKNGKYARLIIKIASLVIQGKTEEANNVKKQLPFRTLTANYRERRLAYGIIRYNPVITLDLDELEKDRLEAIRSLINNDPNTLGSFLSPKRHGYKIFVFRKTEYACRLRAELLQGEIDYGGLEEVHSKLYNDAKQYYEALLGTEIDGSGKDISRGYFISYDPEAYLNTTLQQQIEPLAVHIIAPEKGAKKQPVRKPAGIEVCPRTAASPLPEAEPWEKLLFSKAVTAVKRSMKFKRETVTISSLRWGISAMPKDLTKKKPSGWRKRTSAKMTSMSAHLCTTPTSTLTRLPIPPPGKRISNRSSTA